MAKTFIEWTEEVLNPCTGCTPVSKGCGHCYAKEISESLQAKGIPKYQNGFAPTIHEHVLRIPYRNTKPTLYFVNSMSDLFHVAFPDEFILRVFRMMNETPWHVYIILTKRHERLLTMNPVLNWTPNIIMGVSIEDQDNIGRADYLKQTNALTKLISAEPLLGSLDKLDLTGIDWIITGGESGKGARTFNPEWALELRDKASISGTAFFHKQNGGENKKLTGRLLAGHTYSEYPPVITELFSRR